MSKAAEFIMKSDSFDIEDNPKWDEFCKENPECGNKILKLVVAMLKKKYTHKIFYPGEVVFFY